MHTQIEARLDKPSRSHFVELDYYGATNREEVHPIAEVIFRGQARRVECACDRYLASSGLTDWRVIVRGADAKPGDGIGEKGAEAIREAVRPLVFEWLRTAGYRESRKRAYAHAIKREIQGMTTTADYRARCALEKSGRECTAADRRALERAYKLRLQSLQILETVGRMPAEVTR